MKKVLVIEDDQITCSLHSRILDDQGYSVVTTNNGPDGIALAMRERPNLIVLDLGLPSPKPQTAEFDGYAVMRWLRRSSATKSIPVVIATAWPAEQARDRSVGLGADAFLTKPIKPDDLRKTARILMDDF